MSNTTGAKAAAATIRGSSKMTEKFTPHCDPLVLGTQTLRCWSVLRLTKRAEKLSDNIIVHTRQTNTFTEYR